MTDNTPTRWVLDKEDFDFFVAALDEPPRLIPELAALFREFPPFDEPKVTDEMIERAANQMLLEVLWQTLPNGNIAVGDHKAIAERVLRAALGGEQ